MVWWKEKSVVMVEIVKCEMGEVYDVPNIARSSVGR